MSSDAVRTLPPSQGWRLQQALDSSEELTVLLGDAVDVATGDTPEHPDDSLETLLRQVREITSQIDQTAERALKRLERQRDSEPTTSR